MKIHAYKSHKVLDLVDDLCERATLALTGLCGGSTHLPALAGEDVQKSIKDGIFSMFTRDPGKVTCGSCRRSKTFSLFELAATEI